MTSSQERELAKRAEAWRKAKDAERARIAALKAAIAEAAEDMTEAEIVRVTNVSRVTVRKALGKDQRRRSSAVDGSASS